MAAIMQQAAKSGALGRGRLGDASAATGTRATTLRLLIADIEEARRQAESTGLRYQTYIRMLLHEKLEERKRKRAG
ncbi:MAG: hypothetical protein ACRD1L_06690 [Terriglobales bacterium]